MTVQILLSCVCAVFAVLAAGLWVKSSRVTVYYVPPKPGEMRGGTVLFDDAKGRTYDVPATLDLQSKWNKRAALAAAAAAIFQGLSAAPFFGAGPLWGGP